MNQPITLSAESVNEYREFFELRLRKSSIQRSSIYQRTPEMNK